MSSSTYLAITWSTSRGRDTYGYNICRLDDQTTGKRYRCNGGGYDMLGAVFGDWLQEAYQAQLRAIGDRFRRSTTVRRFEEAQPGQLYGGTFYADRVAERDGDTVVLDGACGIESMIRITEALGLKVTRTWNRKGHTTGFIVETP